MGLININTVTDEKVIMTTVTDPALNAAVSTVILDTYGGIIITLTGAGNDQTLQSPTDTTAGKRFTVVVKGAFNIEVNGITMTAGEAQHFIWDGASWVAITAIDADDITFTPASGLTATEVQAAIEEAAKKTTIPIKEENTSALKKGQVVCATGASGEKVKVGLCDCTNPAKVRIMGLVSTDLVQNASGHSIFRGELPGIDSRATNLDINPNAETWAEGAMLWQATTAGGMTHTRPAHGRSIKAAISRKGSCVDDILQVISHENPVNVMAAAGEDIILGMGDSAGINKVKGKDYAGDEKFSFDSKGRLLAKTKEIVQAATDTLTVAEISGTQINNYGQSAENTQTLPAAAEGLCGIVIIATAGAGAFHLKAAANDKFYLDGVAGSDNGSVSIAVPVVGATIYFFTFQTGATAWDWYASTIAGNWVAV